MTDTRPLDRAAQDAASHYAGRRVALLTQHGKEHVIGPVLGVALGCVVERVGDYDTDRLGTFTRETPRFGTQLDAAREKARIGMRLSGLPLGVASEGSFGADPVGGFLPWNLELVAWLDDAHGIEVFGRAQGPGASAQLLVRDWDAAARFAHRAGFPEHALVVRPDGPDGAPVHKGLVRWPDFEAAFRDARDASADAAVFVELDVRAHVNPTRQRMIERATRDLAARLASGCLECATPGFGVVDVVAGLPCSDCAAPTRVPRADVFACVKCAHRRVVERSGAADADPTFCDRCNP